MAPGTFNGMEVRRKVYRFNLAQSSESDFRSHSSPIGMPKRLRKY